VKVDNGRFFYVQYDPRDDEPNGVSPILPVLSMVWMQIRILVDLAEIMKKVGFPRVDIQLLEEVLIKNAPPNIRTDAVKLQAYLDDTVEHYRSAYLEVQPEDAYVHSDSIKIGMLESKSGSQAFDVRALMEIVDQQISSALKTLPTLLGRSTGKTGTFSDSQIKLYKATIESMQRVSEMMLSRLLTKALHFSGRRGQVVVKYVSVELRSETEVEQWQATKINNEMLSFLLYVTDFDSMRRNIARTPGALPDVEIEDKEARELVKELLGRGENKPVERSGPGTQKRDSQGLGERLLEAIDRGSLVVVET